jgi:hypothetical protein
MENVNDNGEFCGHSISAEYFNIYVKSPYLTTGDLEFNCVNSTLHLIFTACYKAFDHKNPTD